MCDIYATYYVPMWSVGLIVYVVVTSQKTWSVYLYMYIYARPPGGPCAPTFAWENGTGTFSPLVFRITQNDHASMSQAPCLYRAIGQGQTDITWVAIASVKSKPCFLGMCYVITCRCTLSVYHTPMRTNTVQHTPWEQTMHESLTNQEH